MSAEIIAADTDRRQPTRPRLPAGEVCRGFRG
jgi:hypothetical protein